MAAVFLGLVAGLITVTWKLNTYSSEVDAHLRDVLQELVFSYSGTPTTEELSRRFPHIEHIIKEDIIDYQSRKSGVTSPTVQFAIGELLSLYTGFNPPKYSEAEKFAKQIASDYKIALGESNALTLKQEKQVLALYLAEPQPKLAEAESYFEERFDAKRNALGDENPATQVTLNYLVSVYLEQGTVGYAKAASLLEPIVNETHRKLGSENPATRNASIALANVYLKQGRYREAEILLIPYAANTTVANAIVHPLDLTEQIAVPDQPWPISVHTYGGMPADFVDSMTRITILEHPSIVDALDRLAQTYERQGRNNEAQATKKTLKVVLEAALSSTQSVGGWEFGRPLKSMGVMAIRYIEEDRLVDADAMVNAVLDGYSQVAGKSSNAEEIPTLLTSAALTYSAKGNYPKAEELLNAIVKIEEAGTNRKFTLSHSLVRLKSWYVDQGRTQDALRIGDRMKEILPASDQSGQLAPGTSARWSGVYDSAGFIPK
jgi:tetratricopeptide (TPR) repeat protein